MYILLRRPLVRPRLFGSTETVKDLGADAERVATRVKAGVVGRNDPGRHFPLAPTTNGQQRRTSLLSKRQRAQQQMQPPTPKRSPKQEVTPSWTLSCKWRLSGGWPGTSSVQRTVCGDDAGDMGQQREPVLLDSGRRVSAPVILEQALCRAEEESHGLEPGGELNRCIALSAAQPADAAGVTLDGAGVGLSLSPMSLSSAGGADDCAGDLGFGLRRRVRAP